MRRAAGPANGSSHSSNSRLQNSCNKTVFKICVIRLIHVIKKIRVIRLTPNPSPEREGSQKHFVSFV